MKNIIKSILCVTAAVITVCGLAARAEETEIIQCTKELLIDSFESEVSCGNYSPNNGLILENGAARLCAANGSVRLISNQNTEDTADGILVVSVKVRNNVEDDAENTNVMSLSDVNGSEINRAVSVNMQNGKLTMTTDDYSSGTRVLHSVSAPYQTGKIYSVKVVLDIDSKKAALYVDHQKIGENCDVYPKNGVHAIRRAFETNNSGSGFDYTLDNLKIWKGERSTGGFSISEGTDVVIANNTRACYYTVDISGGFNTIEVVATASNGESKSGIKTYTPEKLSQSNAQFGIILGGISTSEVEELRVIPSYR